MVPCFVLEGKKIDHLVQENEGGRKLANQIVRQVFRPRGNKEEKLASGHRVSVFQAHILMLIKQEVSLPYTMDPAPSGYTFLTFLICILTFSLEQKFKCTIEKIFQETLCCSFHVPLKKKPNLFCSDIEKLISNASPGSTKKSTKFSLDARYEN